MKRPKFKLEKKFVAQVKFYEVLFKITDDKGEAIYVGSEESAKKVLRALNAQKRGSK